MPPHLPPRRVHFLGYVAGIRHCAALSACHAAGLRYFASLLKEVRTESFPASCWQHLEFNVRQCERLGEDRRAEGPGRACPDLEQADPFGEVRRPSSAAGKARYETG